MLVVLATTMITTNDALFKHLSQMFSVGQIMFIRGVLVCAIFTVVLLASKQAVFNKRALHRWNIIRALLELAATLVFLTGLSLLPLAIASTLAFSSPIVLAILAAVFLREQVDWVRWVAIIAGFIGVAMIANPFADEVNWAVLFPIACAILVALRDLAIRYVPDDIPSLHVAFTNAWMVMLGGGLLCLFQGWRPVDITWYFWFAGLAVAILGGYTCYVMGTRLGELSFLAPFKYVSVLLAIAIGYFVWSDVPTVLMLSGAAVIVGAGIVLLVGEKRRL